MRWSSSAAVALLVGLILTVEVEAQTGEASFDSVNTFKPEPIAFAKIAVPIHPAVAPSPGGRFFAVLQVRPDPVLWVVPGDGGEPIAYRKMWAAYMPRWAPSGNRIGFVAGFGPPRIWTIEVDPASGRPVDPPRMLYRAEVNAYAFSPDGEWIAFVPRRSTAKGASEIYIIEWETRKVRFLLRESGLIYRLDWAPDGAHIYYGLAPDAIDDPVHRVVRASVRGGSRATVMETGEYLGLAPDGVSILHRPNDFEAIRVGALEIASRNGEPLLRIAVPRGVSPTWGASSAYLVQVRANEAGDEIVAIPSPLLWPWFGR
ncbi:MAG TPA: hypothetical protein VLC48_10295 [Gemmatimonadota bacterium]|nr:hypothetical protein [Gemmatimonadota bacterium]